MVCVVTTDIGKSSSKNIHPVEEFSPSAPISHSLVLQLHSPCYVLVQ